ncbi:MAG: PDZ domain-containing protein [bacterium]
MRYLKLIAAAIFIMVFCAPVLQAVDTPSYEVGFYAYPLDYIRILNHESFFPEKRSLFVTELEEESRFARAGLRKEDIITSLNGSRINSYKQAREIIDASRGSTVAVTVLRLNPRFRYKRRENPFYQPRSLEPYRDYSFSVEIPEYVPPDPVPVLEGPGGHLYHAFGKTHSPDSEHTRVFKSKREAEEAGLKPCGICFSGSSEEGSLLDDEITEDLVGVGLNDDASPVFKKLKSKYGIISEIPEDMKNIAERIFPYRVRTYLEPEIVYVDTDRVYAFGLPEGKLVITRGTWEMLETEAEKAFHLAHVLAHVDMRHTLTVPGKGKVFELLEKAAKNAAGSRAWGYLSRIHEELADHFLGVRFSEHGYSIEDEREAVCLAYINLYRAGYDFEGFEIYLKKREDMVEDLQPRWTNFLLHHPLPGNLETQISIWEKKVPDFFNRGVLTAPDSK